MIINSVIKGGGGGGAGFLLDIAFHSILPASVTNNQIAVVTDVVPNKITFSYATPESPAGGDLWIHTVDNDGYTLPAYSADYGAVIKLTPGATMQFNGSIWEYRNAYIGLNGEWKMFSTQSPFSSLTWAQIIAIANSGEDPSLFFAVGDEHALNYDSGAAYHTVAIGDFHHNTITGTNKTAALALTMKDCIGTQHMHSSSTATNVGGWRDGTMRKSYMPYYLNRLPSELLSENAIKYVDVLSAYGNRATSIVTSSDKLRLHSSIELGVFSSSYAASGEGTVYAYYYTAANRIKTYNGAATNYWTRTPYIKDVYSYNYVGPTGTVAYAYSSTAYSVAFAFDI